MSKKFTEEQYQKIVDVADKYPAFGKKYIVPNGGEGELSTTDEELIKVIFGSLYNPEKTLLKVQYMIAIANPLTREWAHDKFVEKEKKYYWTSKKSDNENERYRLYRRVKRSKGSGITSYFNLIGRFDNDVCEQLTESEIREWGYNPEMFDKEEV